MSAFLDFIISKHDPETITIDPFWGNNWEATTSVAPQGRTWHLTRMEPEVSDIYMSLQPDTQFALNQQMELEPDT
jgi:hypothetical protein